ncbi:MAG: tripartite tricarboxylate transporter substrate binding protein, partial [Pseudomonadota bacterium]
MRRMRIHAVASATILVVAILATRAGAAFPEKPIQFVIPFGAGGGADIEGRVLAKEMSKILGVPVVPVNKPGAGGAVAYTYVKNAKPDGYTVAWNSTSVLTTTNIGNVPFKHSALAHIGRVEYQPMPFAVRADAPWKTFKAFVAACKAKPGTLKVANSGSGSATHLAAIAIQNAIGCKVIHLPVGIKRR